MHPLPVSDVSVAVAPTDAGARPRDDVDSKAARLAIEADGYKSVTGLSRGSDGSWRAKAYRGTTAVQLTVNAAGQVSAD